MHKDTLLDISPPEQRPNRMTKDETSGFRLGGTVAPLVMPHCRVVIAVTSGRVLPHSRRLPRRLTLLAMTFEAVD